MKALLRSIVILAAAALISGATYAIVGSAVDSGRERDGRRDREWRGERDSRGDDRERRHREGGGAWLLPIVVLKNGVIVAVVAAVFGGVWRTATRERRVRPA